MMFDSLLEAFFGVGKEFIDVKDERIFESPSNRLIKPVTLYYYDAKTPGTSWFYKGSFQTFTKNTFIIKGHAFNNTIQVAEPGESEVSLCDNSRFNFVQGGEGNDWAQAQNNATHNVFNGGNGNDAFLARHEASHNTFNAGEGDDYLDACDNASYNIFNGGDGNDVFLAWNQAFANVFNGGNDDDVAISLVGGTFDGGPGDDFILTHLGDQKTVADIIAKGSDGHDILIHSALFWQANSSKLKNYKKHDITYITLDGGSGDDIIMPYLQTDLGKHGGDIESIAYFIKMIKGYYARNFSPSPAISDSIYDITPGLGCDVICLSDRSAEATQTIIKGFDFSQDQLAFPNQDMADAILPHLLKAQAEKLPAIEWIHNGHHYHLVGNQYGKAPPPAGSLSYKIWDETRTNSALAKVKNIRDLSRCTLDGVFTSKTTLH